VIHVNLKEYFKMSILYFYLFAKYAQNLVEMNIMSLKSELIFNVFPISASELKINVSIP
jgi:hypothetical protein